MTIAFKLSTVGIGLGVGVGVFGGADVSVGSGVDDAGTSDMAELTVAEAILFVRVDVLIAGADEPAKLHDVIINANIPAKIIGFLLGLECLFIFYPD